jgi:hypothetical protein
VDQDDRIAGHLGKYTNGARRRSTAMETLYLWR